MKLKSSSKSWSKRPTNLESSASSTTAAKPKLSGSKPGGTKSKPLAAKG